jgi:uncharacterized damage-inducible protein DinB
MNAQIFLKLLDARFAVTRKTIAAIPPDRLDFRPMPDMMSARELALHLVGNYAFLKAGLVEGNWTPDTFRIAGEYPTTESIVAGFDALYDATRLKLPPIPNEVFERRVRPFGAEQKVSSLAQAIAEHEVQHRGQLQVYLRLMGVKPPSAYGE